MIPENEPGDSSSLSSLSSCDECLVILTDTIFTLGWFLMRYFLMLLKIERVTLDSVKYALYRISLSMRDAVSVVLLLAMILPDGCVGFMPPPVFTHIPG